MHNIVVGQTESGKSTLVKRLIKAIKAETGMQSVVLDPLHDPTFDADWQTSNAQNFLKCVFDSKNLVVVVDEAGETIGHYEKEMFKLATRGRHCGHICFFIAQRAKLIHPTVRNNCGAAYIFNQSFDDCKMLSNDFNDAKIIEAANFVEGEYFYKRRMRDIKKFKLF
jgi:GTPase SAR1 family protein